MIFSLDCSERARGTDKELKGTTMNRRLFFLIACLPTLLLAQSLPSSRSQRPKLVLFIAVDQFRYDYFPRFRTDYTGGLKLLLDRGANFVDAHLEHYPT